MVMSHGKIYRQLRGCSFLMNQCLKLTLLIGSATFLQNVSYASSKNDLPYWDLLKTYKNTYQGCTSGCLHSNMSVKHLLQGRRVSGNRNFKDESQVIPEWTNYTLFRLGQKFAQDNIGFLGMSHLFALLFDNIVPDVKQILLVTGTTSSAEGAAKRYTATAIQVALWYQHSLDDPIQKSILLNSLHQTRRHHNDAAVKVVNKLKDKHFLQTQRKKLILQMSIDKQSIFNDLKFWTAFQADVKLSRIPKNKRTFPPYTFEGIPITQFSHAMIQFSFAGMAVLYRRQVGILNIKEEELQGFIHFWGVIGHALGVKDEYNICMQASLQESTRLFQSISEEIALPSLFAMDETSHILLSAYLDGLRIMDPVTTPRFMMYRFLRDIAQVKPLRMNQQLTAIDRFYISVTDGVMSNNLMINKLVIKVYSLFSMNVNGYKFFGGNYTTEERKSRNVFYTKEKLAF